MKLFLASLLAFSIHLNLFAQNIKIDVTLNPVGSFAAESTALVGKVIGKLDSKTKKKVLTAENIVVKIDTFKTGIEFRDKHFKEKLEYQKHPELKLLKAIAAESSGKGSAIVEAKGVKKKISFTFKIDGSSVKFEFDLNVSDFKIEAISYKGVGVEDKLHISGVLPLERM